MSAPPERLRPGRVPRLHPAQPRAGRVRRGPDPRLPGAHLDGAGDARDRLLPPGMARLRRSRDRAPRHGPRRGTGTRRHRAGLHDQALAATLGRWSAGPVFTDSTAARPRPDGVVIQRVDGNDGAGRRRGRPSPEASRSQAAHLVAGPTAGCAWPRVLQDRHGGTLSSGAFPFLAQRDCGGMVLVERSEFLAPVIRARAP